ncbi:hypothetical protein H7U37_02930 [Pseudoflavonifractor phocaeensis]|uniref:YczE/YyaS/YitT family protein n=1 Tax=Pseudoflavonifractor phocaeensis TaxID=1870988 RepID=UPI0019567D13|nr:DUF6198 family protein [Pseudoflavonifractor phocaeensis]MBM6869523.1 hypothetical protein [Pseudoflavonifractor phocaeensis]MBM6937483.1 hypothetical protein [Pseudoflavonifractor phocaeensis]
MHKLNARQFLLRVGIYVVGLFFMALGVALSVNANLGISPVNSLPYVVSVISGIDQGTCVIIIFCLYILVQILILRREFRLIDLTQIVFSTIFGYLVNFAKWLVGDFALPTYVGQLVMMAVSIVVVALGVALYVEAGLVNMPMEGMTMAMARKLGKPFHNVKIVVDCFVVALGAILSLVFLHRLDGVREGTVIAAVVTGKILALIKPRLVPLFTRLGLYDQPMTQK